jgi:large repetitive protein
VTYIRHSAHPGAVISCPVYAARATQSKQASKNQPLPQPSRWWSELRHLVSLLLAVFLSFHCALSSAQQTANYIYDELGRLKTVVAPNGDRAEYDYDAVGNLLAVRRIGTNTLAVSEITPNVGTSGTVVTIRGAGFSATPASNTVKFNGVAATVTAATTTQLTVAAPATGTTGTISVTVAAATATSQEIFTYVTGTTVGGPTITSFSPVNGPATTQVTIIGTNFELAPGATKVELNGMNMPIVSLTATQIVVSVPADVGSGKIRVITPKGIAVSTAYFYVPIPGYADVDIVDRQSITIGGAASTVNVATANKYGLLLFEGAQNDYVTLQISGYINSQNNYTSYSIYKPDNTLFAQGGIGLQLLYLHIPRLTQTGTYSIIFSPGNATTSFTTKLARDGSLTVGATATAVTGSAPGQSLRFSFSVPLGGTVSIGLTELIHNPADPYWTDISVYRPDSKIVTAAQCLSAQNGCNVDVVNAFVSGSYSVVIKPPTASIAASFKLTLSNPVSGTLTVGSATATAVTTTRAGQSARYTFTATAGQNVGIGLTDLVTTPGTVDLTNIAMYLPNGDLVSSSRAFSYDGGGTLNASNLVAGTYNIIVSMTQAATASFKLQVNNDALGTLATNAATNVSLKPGQNARYTFSGTAGQSVGIELAQLLTVPAGKPVTIYVYRPTDVIKSGQSGTFFTGAWKQSVISDAGGTLTLPTLPTTGTYTVIVDDPTFGLSANFALKANTGNALVTGAVATNATTTAAGQNPRYTFDVALGSTVGIGLTNLGYTPSTETSSTAMTVYKPDGTQLLNTVCIPAENGCNLSLINADIAGTYSIVIAPPPTVTAASFKILLSAPVTGTLTVDSANATPVTIARAGQNARYTFNATAGQTLGFGLSELVMVPNSVTKASFTVYLPDGSVFFSNDCIATSGGCGLNLPIPTTGVYSVVISMTQAATGSFKLQVNSYTLGTLVTNVASNVSLKPGQNARYTFHGTAGQSVGIELAQLVTLPAGGALNIYIYRPTDTITFNGPGLYGEWVSTYIFGAGGSLSLPPLPTTGTYTVIVQAYEGRSATFALKVNAGDALIAGAAATTVTTTTPGQNPRYNFDVALGARLTVALTGLSYTPSTDTSPTRMTVYAPDGVPLPAVFCYRYQTGCSIDVVNTTGTGTYSVVIAPPTTVTSASFTLQLSVPVTGTLTVGSASSTAVTIARAGQFARYTFTATAGQNLGVGLSDLVITPTAVTTANLTVYRPDETALTTVVCYVSNGGCALNLNNLAAGTYSVVASMTQPSTGSFKLQVNSDVVGTLATNVASSVSLKPGQNARYTFSGTAGQSVGIELSQLATAPSGKGVTIHVYRPADSITVSGASFSGYWRTVGINGAGSTLALPTLPVTGTYTVIVDDSYSGVAATFALKVNAGSTLVANAAAANVTTTAAGQNPRYTFDVAVGATVSIGITSLTYSPNTISPYTNMGVAVYRPDGTSIGGTGCSPAYNGCQFELVNAAVAGIYSVVIEPPAAATSASFSILLSAPVTGTLIIGSPSGSAATITRAGQVARYTFTATAGQNLGLALSEVTIAPSVATLQRPYMRLYDPSGMPLIQCQITDGGCPLNLNNAAAGTYSVIAALTEAATGSFKLYVNNDAVGALATNAATNVSLKPGQNARYTFNGTAGQSMAIELSQLVTVPTSSDRFVYVFVYRPTDTTATFSDSFNNYWQGISITGTGGTLTLPALPTTGTYTVIVDDPTYGMSATFALKARSP